MGYESDGTGTFMLREGKNLPEAFKAVEEAGFNIHQTFGLFVISFQGWKVYTHEKELELIKENFNGEFYIDGDNVGDMWLLIFQDGKIFFRKGTIVYGERQELKTINAIWK